MIFYICLGYFHFVYSYVVCLLNVVFNCSKFYVCYFFLLQLTLFITDVFVTQHAHVKIHVHVYSYNVPTDYSLHWLLVQSCCFSFFLFI